MTIKPASRANIEKLHEANREKGAQKVSMFEPYRQEILELLHVQKMPITDILRKLNDDYGLKAVYQNLYFWLNKNRRHDEVQNLADLNTPKRVGMVTDPELDKILEDYARIVTLGNQEFRENPELFKMATRGAEILFLMKKARLEAESKAEALRQRRKEKAFEAKHRKMYLALQREKFEFDAAKKVLQAAAELKGIQTDDRLTINQKVEAVRVKIFGDAA